MEFPISFIRHSAEFATLEKNVPAPYFRRTFEIKENIKSATLLICGLGFYIAHINGKDITKGYLAPYRSNHDDYIYFDKYDIKEELKTGKNVLAGMLGNGMQNSNGGFIWEFDKAIWRGAPQVSFSVEIEYENGEKQTVISDTETKTHYSPILFDDLHFGEYYDATLEIKGWDMPDLDDCDWKNAEMAPTPRGEARLCNADPIVCTREIKPVSIKEYDGGYIYDFGENNTGLARLCINGTKGQKLLLQYFEILTLDGKPYPTNIRFHAEDRFQENEYTCSGEGNEVYVSHFTYYGYRYIYIKGITAEQANEDLLTYLVISSDLKVMGHFECDNEIVNKIEEATVRSDISNFHYFPTDCPHREKNGWTADAALSAEQMLLNFSPEKSYAEWLRNIYKSMKDNGQLPGIIPNTGWGYEWGNGPAWDCVIVYLPYYTYIYRGDASLFNELQIPLMRYLTYIYSRLDENNLLAIGLGDWCQPGQSEPTTPLIVTDSIMVVDIAEKAAFIFDVLGAAEQKEYAKRLADKVRSAVREKLYDCENGIAHCGTQTALAMGIFYNIFTKDESEKAIKNLVKVIEEGGNFLDTGVVGARVLFDVLAQYGYQELAYYMITRPENPSYANPILEGATTLPERFIPKGEHVWGTDSKNHHFWGFVSGFFYLYLAGLNVNPTKHNVNQVKIEPKFVEGLNYVEASHILPAGIFKVTINRFEGKAEIVIDKPWAVEIDFVLPSGYEIEEKSISAEKEIYSIKKA